MLYAVITGIFDSLCYLVSLSIERHNLCLIRHFPYKSLFGGSVSSSVVSFDIKGLVSSFEMLTEAFEDAKKSFKLLGPVA